MLDELPMEDYMAQSELFSEDLYEEISLETCVKKRISMGSTGPESVRVQIAYFKEMIKELKA